MGVPIRRTTVRIYALGGLYSALGGVIYALYTASGYPLAGTGNELSAIASVVLGGTLLTGGVGLVVGTLFGGLILGLIATIIDFDGSLNGAWIMIVGGLLLFIFILAQRTIMGSFMATAFGVGANEATGAFGSGSTRPIRRKSGLVARARGRKRRAPRRRERALRPEHPRIPGQYPRHRNRRRGPSAGIAAPQ